MFNYSSKELACIDQQLEPLIARASQQGLETQQLALDATRLLSCTEDRLDEYKDKGFFKRCWSKLSGKTSALERANQNDLIEMQRIGWRYLNILQERDLMLAHSIIAVKNNLLTLAVKEEETRRAIIELAERIDLRFVALEDRVGRLEVATNIHSWLLTLEMYDYDQKFSPYIRLLRVVKDFYQLKASNWNLQEIKYLQKAVREVGLDARKMITIGDFIEGVIDEIDKCSIQSFRELVCLPADEAGNFIPSKFVLDEIAVPFYSSLARIEEDYSDSLRTIKVLAKRLSISPKEAHKETLMTFVKEDGIDTTVAIPLRDLAVELLACMGLTAQLFATPEESRSIDKKRIDEIAAEFEKCIGQSTELDKKKISPYMVAECERAAKVGYAVAQWLFGSFLLHSIHRDKNEEEAVKWFRLAAEQGNPDGQFSLGWCYKNGTGVSNDEREAVKWFRLAAEQGNPTGQICLGACYQNGTGVSKDEHEAAKWYRLVAEHGNPYGQNNLGFCYQYGICVPKDEREAVKWYRLAAEQGNPYGQNNLGFCYQYGICVPKDEREAVKWYRLSAEQGNPNGQVNLGLCYQNGICVPKDEHEAVKWYRLAAEQGNPNGQVNLGLCYQTGTGLTKDEHEAVKWYRLAAEQGNPDGQHNLGWCYAKGISVPQDEREAVKWYRLAAEQGSLFGQYILGSCYENGTGVSKDEREAVKWYRLAAEQGYEFGQWVLGTCYENGTGVPKDEREAVKWYRLAAEQGNSNAEFNLGECYRHGIGVLKDEHEAVKWYRLAAEQGNPDGQVNLGLCYQTGTGVSKDKWEAARWYGLAAEQGDPRAQELLVLR